MYVAKISGLTLPKKLSAIVLALLWIVALGIGMLTVRLAHSSNDDREIYSQLDLFGDVLQKIRSDYVEKPDDEKLVEAAINGMLTSLDPHSSYLSPKNFQEMQVHTSGEFGGLGIEVTMEDGIVKVVSPIEDTPAARAGIQPGDLITHIDGKQVMGLKLGEAVDMMRGKVNTPIDITVIRKGMEGPFDVRIVREIISINPVKSRAEDNVGYIRISTFSEQTYSKMTTAIKKLKKDIGPDLEGFVLDLRNNPGGLLSQSIRVADAFLDKGAIVMTRGRNARETQRANAHEGDIISGKKLVVLINGGSASASEIVAGSLQDHKRATIVGTRSFGKGSVQTIIPMGRGNGAIRLTTARYYTPSGRSIQAKGIEPDKLVQQKLPDKLKKFAKVPRGEASLPGHLSNSNKKSKEEASEEYGSSSYIPTDKLKDRQLHYALNFVRGIVLANVPNPVKKPVMNKGAAKAE
jgi:carboxyl-terminal processing protease